jgi:hypothetical protein
VGVDESVESYAQGEGGCKMVEWEERRFLINGVCLLK